MFWGCLLKNNVLFVKWIFLNLLYIFSIVLVLFIQRLCHFMVGLLFIQKLCLFSQMNISQFAVYILVCLFKCYVILVKWILLDLLCTFSGIVYEEVISVHWPSKFYDQPHSLSWLSFSNLQLIKTFSYCFNYHHKINKCSFSIPQGEKAMVLKIRLVPLCEKQNLIGPEEELDICRK